MGTPSPADRPLSLSPAAGLPAGVVPGMHRQNSDYAYMHGNMNVPPHLRNEMPQPSPRSSPSLTSQTYTPNVGAQRPTITSHPNGYGPPQILEPSVSANHNQSGGTTSANGSPHMTAMGWQSPAQQALPSPGTGENYVYPDPHYGGNNNNMYYGSSGIRRPNSTEPDHYNPNQQRLSNEMWAPAVQ